MAKVFNSDSDKKYQNFYKLYKKAHPCKNGNAVTTEAAKIWRETLNHGKDEEKYEAEMARLTRLLEKPQKKGSMWSFLNNNKPKPPESKESIDGNQPPLVSVNDEAGIEVVNVTMVTKPLEEKDKEDKRKETNY